MKPTRHQYMHMYAITGLLLPRIVMLMPMFIKTLFLALLFLSGSAFAEWQLVDIGPQGDMFYIDPATIRKDGNMRTVWRKKEVKTREKDGVSSSRAKLEIDCKKELIRVVSFASFADPNLRGELLARGDYPNDAFSAIAPYTLNSAYMEMVCK